MAVYLSCGSNLDDRQANIETALANLESSGKARILRRSRFYETSPVEFTEQPAFLNSVVEIDTALSPEQLLELTRAIELAINRIPRFPKGPRLVDLDILLFGDVRSSTPSLQLPHPAICRRKFVLVPLLEIAAEAWCPVHERSYKVCLQQLHDPTQRIEVFHG